MLSLQGDLYVNASKTLALSITVPPGFLSNEVTIKFEDKAFSKKIHFCSIFITGSGANVPCLDVNRNFQFPRCRSAFSVVLVSRDQKF